MYSSVKKIRKATGNLLRLGLCLILVTPSISIAETSTVSATASTSTATQLGIGKTPSAAQIKGWDIDVRPDGKGLPEGIEGDLELGEATYDEKCAVCHGSFGESVARWPKLAGGDVSQLKTDRAAKTIGSYWPYATTLWDYINRAMPFHTSKTLNPEEVYALTGYILYLNDLVDDDFVANKDTILEMNQKMPNRRGFYFDDRPDSPNTRCMRNCVEAVSIHSEAAEIGVTPDVESNIADTNSPTNTENNEGSGKNGGSEVSTSQEAVNEADDRALEIYNTACGVCHNTGIAGSPKLAEKADWEQRLKQGIEKLIDHAINGVGGMPAKGGQMQLSDEEVASVVNYMVKQAQ